MLALDPIREGWHRDMTRVVVVVVISGVEPNRLALLHRLVYVRCGDLTSGWICGGGVTEDENRDWTG